MNEWVHKKLKLSHHKHTKQRLPHHHTSFGVLLVLMLFVGVILFGNTVSVAADGSINLNGLVNSPPPSEKAVIQTPADGTTVNTRIVQVSGTCPNDTFVHITVNGLLGGSTMCYGGNFSLDITLTQGGNTLIAKVVDAANQAGPDSDPVTVTYTLPTPGPGGTGGNPPGSSGGGGSGPTKNPTQDVPRLLFTGRTYLRSTSIGTPYALEAELRGGQAPYAILIDWGDGTQGAIPQAKSGHIHVTHNYEDTGIQIVVITVTDSAGNKATLQYIVIVNGPPGEGAAVSSGSSAPYVPPTLPIIWPLYLFILALLLAFWLGEKYELHKLKRSHRLAA